MGKFKDLTGEKFGRLTVIERAENAKDGRARWRCRCDCGNEIVTKGKYLFNGNTKSCGCWKREIHFKDLSGQKFGRLTVIERAENNKRGQARWRCRCDCGNEVVVVGSFLTSGETKSCGCLSGQRHGLSNNTIYQTWADIKKRCFNPNCKSYKHYGARGISIFPAWIKDFQAFYNYVSKLPHFGEKGYTLDRINNDGNYEPDNIRWADWKTQNRNRRTNVLVEYKGETMCLRDAAELSGINYYTLYRKYKQGLRADALF